MIFIGLKKRATVFMLTIFFAFLSIMTFDISAQDKTPALIYEGRETASVILNNLDYTDVTNSEVWARDAIWETGALELMKGYGEKRFGPGDALTIEQALRLAYNMAGREAEAQLAAEALDLERNMEDRKIRAMAMWSDGYLQLAYNDGLITQQQYDDAFQADQFSLLPADFHRNGPVTREDMAFYIAKILEIAPVNQQTYLFNAFRDWQQADPHRIPYIEALLQNRIMNGNSNGTFSPKGYVTRAQAAQIIMNAEPFIFQKLGMEKLRGTVEGITHYTEQANGEILVVAMADVRNTDGTLSRFHFTAPFAAKSSNEMAEGERILNSKGLIINDGGSLKNETALAEGQEISYIVRQGEVLYATVLRNLKNIRYRLGRIMSVDEPVRTLRSEMLLNVPFSDIRMLSPETLYNLSSPGEEEVLVVSEDALIFIDFVQKTMKDIQNDSVMLFTIENNLVTVMEKVNLDRLQEKGIVSGIIEENNTELGYVTLFFPDGSGASPAYSRELSAYRTYSYLNASTVEAFKNGQKVSLEVLQPGDSAFLKIDDNGFLIRISGRDNFYPVYGSVRLKESNALLLDKQDGTVERIQIPTDTPVFQERKRVSWKDIKEGDNVRILLQKTASSVVIGEIALEKVSPEISGIYTANLLDYDSSTRNLTVSGLKQFKDGIWRTAAAGGISQLKMDNDCEPSLEKGTQGTIFLAMGTNLLGNETVINMAIAGDVLRSEVINDTLLEVNPGRGSFALLNRDALISYDASSIIVKGGKLLEPNQVREQDNAYIVTGSLLDGSQRAGIIWLQEEVADTGLSLYRGRISGINALSDMTMESFSTFDAPFWQFVNVPKTLTIDPAETRVFDHDGRTDLLEFDDKGESSFRNRTVYVLAREGKALLISTAPYGDVVSRGRILKTEGLEKDAFGNVITQPNTIQIGELRVYNPQTWIWEAEETTSINLSANTVLVKNGSIIKAEALEEGDRITVIRTDEGTEAYVVFAESY